MGRDGLVELFNFGQAGHDATQARVGEGAAQYGLRERTVNASEDVALNEILTQALTVAVLIGLRGLVIADHGEPGRRG